MASASRRCPQAAAVDVRLLRQIARQVRDCEEGAASGHDRIHLAGGDTARQALLEWHDVQGGRFQHCRNCREWLMRQETHPLCESEVDAPTLQLELSHPFSNDYGMPRVARTTQACQRYQPRIELLRQSHIAGVDERTPDLTGHSKVRCGASSGLGRRGARSAQFGMTVMRRPSTPLTRR